MSSILIEEPKVEIEPSLLEELETLVYEQGQVVIHCLLSSIFPTYIRIWPTTYLYDKHSDHRSELVHAEKICYFPEWKLTHSIDTHFSLIFSGLPKTCVLFDLIEHCENEGGAFKVHNIPRNDSDVYYVKF